MACYLMIDREFRVPMNRLSRRELEEAMVFPYYFELMAKPAIPFIKESSNSSSDESSAGLRNHFLCPGDDKIDDWAF
jgi:hypothetical protein